MSHVYFAYIRVSTVKQGEKGVSLSEQREAILRYAGHNEIEVSRWFEEQETAAKRGRRVFGEMLKLLKRGKARGVIIHKIDRSARNLRDWADMGELIDHGIEVHFANESLDLSSRGGRLSADIQAVVAADYIRNLREETRKGFYGRLKQGLYPMQAPVGYLDRGGGRPKEIDPVRGPLVRKIFELYSRGSHTLESLVTEAEKIGLCNRRGGAMSMNGLWTMLRNPFYTGIIRIKKTGETFDGIHEQLIGVDLFRRVQDVMDGRSSARVIEHDFVFRRLFECAKCGYALIAERQKGHVYYRCHTRSCPESSVREEWIHRVVRSRFRAFSLAPHESQEFRRALEEWNGQKRKNRNEVKAAIKLQLEQQEALIDRLVDAFLKGAIEEDIFQRKKEAMLLEKQSITEELRKSEREDAVYLKQIRTYLEHASNALQTYESAMCKDKRELITETTSNRTVRDKKVFVELCFPFNILSTRERIPSGDPQRERPRTYGIIIDQIVQFLRTQGGESSD